MSYLHIAAFGEIALGVGYALAALAVIAGVCFAVVKVFGGRPASRWHKRGTVGAGEEEFDPNDETLHSTAS
jgi:hypothetical protein